LLFVNIFKLAFLFFGMCKVIGIMSLKGGVGKTSVTVALGDAFSDLGQRVLLIDGNLSAPNLGVHLNVINPEVTLHEVLSRERNVEDAIHSLEKFDIIPSSLFSKKEFNPLNLKNKLSSLKQSYDIILIDSPPSLGEEGLATMLASDEVLVVTTPDYPTLGSTIKAVKIAKSRGTNISGLVLNKVLNKDFEISPEEVEKTLDLPIMAKIPHDLDIMRALAYFTPSTSHSPNSDASVEFRKLAAILIGQKYKQFRLRDLFRATPSKTDINREIFYERIFR